MSLSRMIWNDLTQNNLAANHMYYRLYFLLIYLSIKFHFCLSDSAINNCKSNDCLFLIKFLSSFIFDISNVPLVNLFSGVLLKEMEYTRDILELLAFLYCYDKTAIDIDRRLMTHRILIQPSSFNYLYFLFSLYELHYKTITQFSRQNILSCRKEIY